MTRVVASDIVPMSHCARHLWYVHHPRADFDEPELDPFDALIIEKGLVHERKVLDGLAQKYTIEEARSVEHTQELMDQGAPVIYQPQVLDIENELFGKPDFLLRHEDGSYQAADAKFAQSVDTEIGVQVAFYRRLLGNNHPGIVYLATGAEVSIGTEYDAKLLKFITEARSVLGDDERPLVRYSESKCRACPYCALCRPAFVEAEDLSLLYGIDSRSIQGLEAQGISTITELSNADPDAITDVPYLKDEKKRRAVLQAQAWTTGKMTKLYDIEMPAGTWVHFDIEDNPLTPSGDKHVYLWGLLKPPYGDRDFEFVWTDHHDEDEKGWHAFLEKIEEYQGQWPDLKLIHFSHHEYSTIRTYAERYGMEDDETVIWLLDKEAGPLYDIKNAVMKNLVLPLSGYGLKYICKHPDLVNFQWEDEGSGSQWSVVQFNRLLECDDVEERRKIKEAILTYNRDDVRATQKLEEWLSAL